MPKRTWGFVFRTSEPDEEPTEDDHWVGVIPPFLEGSKTERLIPYGIRIRVEVDREHRLVCTGMRLGGPPVGGSPDSEETVELTTRGLREIRINEILAQLGQEPLKPPWLLGELGGTSASEGPASHLLDSRALGRRGHPHEHYQKVAEIYRASGAIKPVKRIAEHFVVEDATARRYVRRARELGFLGLAIPGKAGERVGGTLTVTYPIEGPLGSPTSDTVDSAAPPRETDSRKEKP